MLAKIEFVIDGPVNGYVIEKSAKFRAHDFAEHLSTYLKEPVLICLDSVPLYALEGSMKSHP